MPLLFERLFTIWEPSMTKLDLNTLSTVSGGCGCNNQPAPPPAQNGCGQQKNSSCS